MAHLIFAVGFVTGLFAGLAIFSGMYFYSHQRD